MQESQIICLNFTVSRQLYFSGLNLYLRLKPKHQKSARQLFFLYFGSKLHAQLLSYKNFNLKRRYCKSPTLSVTGCEYVWEGRKEWGRRTVTEKLTSTMIFSNTIDSQQCRVTEIYSANAIAKL